MTPDEQREMVSAARDLLHELGGTLAMLLGARPTEHIVRWGEGRFTVNGRAVAIASIRKQLGVIESKMGSKINKLTDELETGTVTTDGWYLLMRRYVAASHVLAAALALGSVLAAVDDKDVQNRVIAEWRYLDEFVVEIRG